MTVETDLSSGSLRGSRCASFLIFPIHFWHFSLSKMIRQKFWPCCCSIAHCQTLSENVNTRYIQRPTSILTPIFGFYGPHYWHQSHAKSIKLWRFSLSIHSASPELWFYVEWILKNITECDRKMLSFLKLGKSIYYSRALLTTIPSLTTYSYSVDIFDLQWPLYITTKMNGPHTAALHT